MSFMIVALSIGVAAGGAKLAMALSGRKKRIQEQKDALEEMEKMKEEYKDLDTSNLNRNVENQFQNLENTYEDLTVNQQQAQFEAQQSQQSQANIMAQMQGAAGGSGIAALAQTMANQGQLQAQRASASIGMQESQIQRLQAAEASKIQTQERRGEEYAERLRLSGAETARGLEWTKTGTLLGMSQQRVGAANQARAEAKAQQMSAVGDIGQAGMGTAQMGMKARKPGVDDTDAINASMIGGGEGTIGSTMGGGTITNTGYTLEPSNQSQAGYWEDGEFIPFGD